MALGLFPLLLFLNSLGVPERLEWPAEDEPVVRTVWGKDEVAWYWTTQGRFLRETDLAPSDREMPAFYGFLESEEQREDGETWTDQLWRDYRQHADRQTDRKSFEALRYQLAGRAILEKQDLQKLFPKDFTLQDWQGLTDHSFGLFYFEAPENRSARDSARLYIVHDLWEAKRNLFGAHLLIALTRDDVRDARESFLVLQWALLAILLLGVLLLWRRGGDSPVARWGGISLLGASLVLLSPYNDYFLPYKAFALWQVAIEEPFAALRIHALVLTSLLSFAAFAMTLFWIPCARLWIAVYWPDARRGKVVLKWTGAVVLSLAGYWAVSTMVYALSGWPVTPPKTFVAAAAHVLPAALLLAAIGSVVRWVRRRTGRQGPQPLLLVAGVIALQALGFFLVIDAEDVRSAATLPTSGLAYGITASVILFTLAIGWRIIRHDLLHLTGVRDFSFVILYGVAPFLLHWLARDYEVEIFSAGGMVDAEGGQLIALICAIFLLPRVERRLSELFAQVSYPKLRSLAEALESCMEKLSGVSDRESRQMAMNRIFEVFGVRRFALLARQNDEFLLSLGEKLGPYDGVRLSPNVSSYFAGCHAPLDLERLALEWPTFFIQFELERLRRATGARFVLPICLESSLWGLLLLWDGIEERQVTRLPIAARLRPAAIAALHQRSL